MKDNKLKYILVILMTLSMGLFLISCGSSGGDSQTTVDPTIETTEETTETVSGVAATGAAMIGTVSLKDSNGTVRGPQAIGDGGSFSFDVTGLIPPFYIRAEDSGTGEVLYSVSMESGTGNVNPLTNLIVAAAAGVDDPADVYNNPGTYPIDQPGLNETVADIQEIFEVLFDFYGVPGVDPITDPFVANGKGLDEIFDNVDFEIDPVNGVVTVTDTGDDYDLLVMSTDLVVTDSIISVQGTGLVTLEDTSASEEYFLFDVNEASLSESFLEDYYSGYFLSSSITNVTESNGVITILGTGTAIDDTVTYTDCDFTLQITDGSPDDVMSLDFFCGEDFVGGFDSLPIEDSTIILTY